MECRKMGILDDKIWERIDQLHEKWKLANNGNSYFEYRYTVTEPVTTPVKEKKKEPEKTERPWGWYQILSEGSTDFSQFKVKLIEVKPGQKISLQNHRYRSEHWVVIGGSGRINRDDEEFDIYKGESAFIPVGALHRLENPGTEPLLIIEVQLGESVSESDITRFQDIYGRK